MKNIKFYLLVLSILLLDLSCSELTNFFDQLDKAYYITYDSNGAERGEVPSDTNAYKANSKCVVLDNIDLYKEGH